MKTPRTQFENLRPTTATEAPKPHLGNVIQTPITTTTREAPEPHSDSMEERIFVLDQDPNVNPAIMYLHEEGGRRLLFTASPGDDVCLIGLSAGRACFHDNKKHEFFVWNITNQTVDAKIQEFPDLHKREEPPKNEKLDFNTLRLGFGYRGEVVVSSYLAPTAVQPAGKLRVWRLDTRSWEWTKVQDLKLKVRRGTKEFLPLVFFKGTKEDYRFFLRDGIDIFEFKSKGEGTWDFRRVHSTLHCRALGFGPSPCEEVCQTQTPQEEEVEKKVTSEKGRAKSSRERDKVKKD